MKDITVLMKRSILAMMIFATLASCSKEDDIDDIFIERDWKLAFVQEGSIRRSNPDKEYSILFAENTFQATLPGGKSITGNWKANGDTREFHCANVRANGSLGNDTIARKMLQILTNAQSYDGDTHYLKIKEQNNVYLQFHNY